MRYFIVGFVAILLSGCSSLLKFEKAEPASLQADIQTIQEPKPEAAHHTELPKQPVAKIPASNKPPLEIKAEDAPLPCRNIADEDIYQEVKLKFSCIEENVK